MEMFRSIFAESSSDSEHDDDSGEQHTLTQSSSSITDTSSTSQHKQQALDSISFQTNPPVERKWQNFASFSNPLPVPPPILPPPTHLVLHESKKDLASSGTILLEEVSELLI